MFLTVLSASALLAGCVGPGHGGDPPPSPSASSVAGAVRHDEEPVRKRFPRLGDFERVAWQAGARGKTDARTLVPGPTDIRMSGIVWLAAEDAERLRTEFVWRAAEDGPKLLEGPAGYVPDGASWQVSEAFESSAANAATFHADFDRNVVVFDAVNPERTGP